MEMPTAFGLFRLWVWEGERGQEPVALTTIQLDPTKEVMVRVHSECLMGDTFSSLTCDCGPQKELALKKIYEHGNGIFIYQRQEGRNMGLVKKIHAYNLMQTGLDTHEASLTLTGHPDSRDYTEVLTILDALLDGHKPFIRLLTNNPYKRLFLERYGYPTIAETLIVEGNVHNAAYSATKTKKFLHASIGYGPYAGVELSRHDIVSKGNALANLLKEIYSQNSGRKIFIGIGLMPDEIVDPSFAKDIKYFQNKIAEIPNVHLIFHTYYPAERRAQRALARFLGSLGFSYSLQFRLTSETPAGAKVDVELIDSFRPEHAVFQLRSDQWYLLNQTSFVEYFSSPNHFLLLDESWGKGKEEGVKVTRDKILKLLSHGINRIGVVGGYSAQTAHKVFELEDYFKLPISVDAWSNLRTGDTVDLIKVGDYLRFFFPKLAAHS